MEAIHGFLVGYIVAGLVLYGAIFLGVAISLSTSDRQTPPKTRFEDRCINCATGVRP